MSKKTKKNYGFKGNTPKMRVEPQIETLADGSKVLIESRVTTVHNNHRYVPTRGWKKINKEHGFRLLNSLLMSYGVILNGTK